MCCCDSQTVLSARSVTETVGQPQRGFNLTPHSVYYMPLRLDLTTEL